MSSRTRSPTVQVWTTHPWVRPRAGEHSPWSGQWCWAWSRAGHGHRREEERRKERRERRRKRERERERREKKKIKKREERREQVLWFVSAVTLVYLLRGYAYGPVILSAVVAVLVAVVRGHRTAAWLTARLPLRRSLLAATDVPRDEGWSWGQALGVGAWALVILIVGEMARVRRERAIAAGLMQTDSNIVFI